MQTGKIKNKKRTLLIHTLERSTVVLVTGVVGSRGEVLSPSPVKATFSGNYVPTPCYKVVSLDFELILPPSKRRTLLSYLFQQKIWASVSLASFGLYIHACEVSPSSWPQQSRLCPGLGPAETVRVR